MMENWSDVLKTGRMNQMFIRKQTEQKWSKQKKT